MNECLVHGDKILGKTHIQTNLIIIVVLSLSQETVIVKLPFNVRT